MKRIAKESDLFKSKSESNKYDEILESLNKTQKAKKELDRILCSMKLETTFPRKASKKVSESTHDLKKGDFIIKRGTKQVGEIIAVNDDNSLVIRLGGRQIKTWRQEIKKIT